MTSFEFDTSELRALSVDLTRASVRVSGQARDLLTVGALHIKDQMVKEMRDSTHFKGAARAISYDVSVTSSGLEAEIGPASGKGQPGALANIAYFGGSRGGGTVPDPKGALDAEAPKFEKALGDLSRGIL